MMMIDITTQESLRNLYNPDGSALRKAQLRMLDLLKFLDKVCKQNNLIYWLDSGTLLGALRHGGFIPWDDDVDICMPKEDADKLKLLLSNKVFENHIILQTPQTDDGYFSSSWMTLRDLNSKYIMDSYSHNILKYQGLQIDIFIMEDNVPKQIKGLANILQKFLITYPLCDKYKLKVLRPFLKINHHILDYYIYPFLRKFRNSNNCMTYGIGNPFKQIFKKSDIFPLKKIYFEDFEFNAPNRTDIYLKTLYGNWQQIPDNNSIVTHNAKIEFF